MYLTIVEFRKRFTLQEKVRIEMAAIDNPNASFDVRAQSAALRVYLADLASVKDSVDLSDPITIGGVMLLESAGILEPGRAAQILAVEPGYSGPAQNYSILAGSPVPGTNFVVAISGTYGAEDLVDCCFPDDPDRISVARFSAAHIATGAN